MFLLKAQLQLFKLREQELKEGKETAPTKFVIPAQPEVIIKEVLVESPDKEKNDTKLRGYDKLEKLLEERNRKIGELEGKIKAYQDLLLVRDDEISQYNKNVNKFEVTTGGLVVDVDDALRQKIFELNKALQQLKNPNSYTCCMKHYTNKNRNGECDKGNVTNYVHQRIEDLNEKFLAERVEKINKKWEKEYTKFTENHLKELER
jgi:septal ring factor EnvC (AmiA/AmiB activator)